MVAAVAAAGSERLRRKKSRRAGRYQMPPKLLETFDNTFDLYDTDGSGYIEVCDNKSWHIAAAPMLTTVRRVS